MLLHRVRCYDYLLTEFLLTQLWIFASVRMKNLSSVGWNKQTNRTKLGQIDWIFWKHHKQIDRIRYRIYRRPTNIQHQMTTNDIHNCISIVFINSLVPTNTTTTAAAATAAAASNNNNNMRNVLCLLLVLLLYLFSFCFPCLTMNVLFIYDMCV